MGVSRQRIHMVASRAGIQFPYNYNRQASRRGLATEAKSAIATGSAVPVPLTHQTVGRVAELIVAADMTTRGYTVFQPLNYRSRCDLVAMDPTGQNVLRIQVRSGQRRGGHVGFSRKNRECADHFAVVVVGEPIFYDPPIAAIEITDGRKL